MGTWERVTVGPSSSHPQCYGHFGETSRFPEFGAQPGRGSGSGGIGLNNLFGLHVGPDIPNELEVPRVVRVVVEFGQMTSKETSSVSDARSITTMICLSSSGGGQLIGGIFPLCFLVC